MTFHSFDDLSESDVFTVNHLALFKWMKNWEPLVSLPWLAMETILGFVADDEVLDDDYCYFLKPQRKVCNST